MTRSFTMKDETMRTRAGVISQLLSDDLAAFTLRFPWLDAGWLSNFEAAITAAKNPVSDFFEERLQTVTTSEVNEVMKNGVRAFSTLNLYAQLAYPDDVSRQQVFGQKNWATARSNQSKMKDALTLAYDTANKLPYKNDLMAKGMTQGEIDALQTAAIQLTQKDTSQEGGKKQRNISTADRMKANNEVWNLMKQIALASKLVHRDDAARRKQYNLYAIEQKKKTVVVVLVKEAATGNPARGAQVQLTNTQLKMRITNRKGAVKFGSMKMPSEVNVKVVLNGNTSLASAQKTKLRDEVTIEVKV